MSRSNAKYKFTVGFSEAQWIGCSRGALAICTLWWLRQVRQSRWATLRTQVENVKLLAGWYIMYPVMFRCARGSHYPKGIATSLGCWSGQIPQSDLVMIKIILSDRHWCTVGFVEYRYSQAVHTWWLSGNGLGHWQIGCSRGHWQSAHTVVAQYKSAMYDLQGHCHWVTLRKPGG